MANFSYTSLRTFSWLATGSLVVLAVVAAPLTVNAETTSTAISSSIGSTIGVLTSSGTVNLNATPDADGVQTIAADTVTVSTNNSAGYNLKLGLTAAQATLVSGGNSIAAASGTFAAPAALGANSWGYRVDGAGTFGAGPTNGLTSLTYVATTFARVPATALPDTIKTTATTATNNTTAVWYSVAVNTATPSGVYTGNVTYTATTNP